MMLSTQVFADTYSGRILNCDVVNVAPQKWKATFRFEYSYCSECAGPTHTNAMYISVPSVLPSGKPNISTWAVPGWTNDSIVVSSPYVRTNTSSTIAVITGKMTNVIGSNTDVSIEISTASNNAYPALRVEHQSLTTSGSGQIGYYWVTSLGCVNGPSVPVVLPPIEELETPEPEFTLKSAVWELESADVADLPDVSAGGEGYTATIKNVASNNLCMSYVTAGVKKNTYALGVTNNHSSQGGRNVFTLQGGSSSLFYNLQLTSNDGVTSNNFDFPTGTGKYITLSQAASSVDKRSEMCWTPRVNLFKNASTISGMHSDTLNFVVIPKA